MKIKLIFLTICAMLTSGCSTTATTAALDFDKNTTQLQTRNYQSRLYATNDQNRTLRTIIATLQDLDFVIDKADSTLGTVSATKFTNNSPLEITVSVRPKGETALVVRANAQYKLLSVDDPESYQEFFNSLAKSMFVDTQEIA